MKKDNVGTIRRTLLVQQIPIVPGKLNVTEIILLNAGSIIVIKLGVHQQVAPGQANVTNKAAGVRGPTLNVLAQPILPKVLHVAGKKAATARILAAGITILT
ncbi:MAG: hypothetical protein JRE23_17855 [Deltaproteobacteria bacterium]|nr:hypothetical protein [Deltaproteobacteria bacterium]